MAVIKNTGESRRERTPLPWDEKCVALEDAIRRLPIAPVQDPQAMAYSDLIPGIARDPMLMSPIGPPAGYARKPAATATDNENCGICRRTRKRSAM